DTTDPGPVKFETGYPTTILPRSSVTTTSTPWIGRSCASKNRNRCSACRNAPSPVTAPLLGIRRQTIPPTTDRVTNTRVATWRGRTLCTRGSFELPKWPTDYTHFLF